MKRNIVVDAKATGENIARLMKERNITGKELSAMLKVSEQGVSKWLKGRAKPTVGHFVAMSYIFHIKVDDIVTVRETASGKTMTAMESFRLRHETE